MTENIADVVHIGLPKTGTTWFQEQLNRYPGIAPLGKPAIDPRYRSLVDDFIKCDGLDFDADHFSQSFEKLHREHSAQLKGKIKLLSHELLAGEPYAGRDCAELAERIKKVFGKPKILIVIREQAAIIESIYRHYVRGGGPLSLRDVYWRGEGSPCMDIFGTKNLETRFRYDRIIEKYYSLFGKENVLVLPYELLKTAPPNFLSSIFDFCGIHYDNLATLDKKASNASRTGWWISFVRILNIFIRTPFSTSPFPFPKNYIKFLEKLDFFDKILLAHLPKKKKFVDQTIRLPLVRTLRAVLRLDPSNDDLTFRMCIEQAYAESNAKTVALTGLELDKYGYAL